MRYGFGTIAVACAAVMTGGATTSPAHAAWYSTIEVVLRGSGTSHYQYGQRTFDLTATATAVGWVERRDGGVLATRFPASGSLDCTYVETGIYGSPSQLTCLRSAGDTGTLAGLSCPFEAGAARYCTATVDGYGDKQMFGWMLGEEFLDTLGADATVYAGHLNLSEPG